MLAVTDHSHIIESKKKKKSLYYVVIQQLFISPGELQRNQAGVIIMLLFLQVDISKFYVL